MAKKFAVCFLGHLKTVKDNLSKRFLSLFISSNPDSKDFFTTLFPISQKHYAQSFRADRI